MTEAKQWYESMLAQFVVFQAWADDHWEHRDPNNCWDFIHTKPSEDKLRSRADPDPSAAKASLLALWDSFRTKPRQRDQSLHSLKRDMYDLLGLWLCSYFLGAPQPHCWERVVVLANRLGTYPGGAFYSKLSGDIYRYEHRRKEKARRGVPQDGGSSAASQEPLLVMAFDPIVLIPLRDGKTSFVEDMDDIEEDEAEYRRRVGQLSFRYLRMEAWQYWSNPENPIVYMVSQELASKALQRIEVRLRHPSQPHSEALMEASNSHLLRLLNISKDKTASVQRHNQEILVVNPEKARLKGLSSCYLGGSVGVVAIRPNLPNLPSAYCSWVEGEVLALERKKLENLRTEVKADPTCSKFNAAHPESFSWYDPSVWVLRRSGL